MAKRIVVNAGVIETRVALQENNLLTALYVERHRRRSIVGNVCKGIVTNVLPGMQAAFVDIGLEKAAFLHVSDLTGPDLVRDIVEEPGDEPDAVDVEVAPPRRPP